MALPKKSNSANDGGENWIALTKQDMDNSVNRNNPEYKAGDYCTIKPHDSDDDYDRYIFKTNPKRWVKCDDGGKGTLDVKVKISSGDTTNGYLQEKLIAGANITITKNNSGANETITISSIGDSDTNTYVTGGTFSNGTATYTNNAGGTFNVTGFSTSNVNQLVGGTNISLSPSGGTGVITINNTILQFYTENHASNAINGESWYEQIDGGLLYHKTKQNDIVYSVELSVEA